MIYQFKTYCLNTILTIIVVYYCFNLILHFWSYRWYKAQNIKPLFPFGHGLSYTNFKYSNLQLLFKNKPIKQIHFNSGRNNRNIYTHEILVVQFNIENIGLYDGTEISQLYITFPYEVDEPPQQLKGFFNTFLLKNENKEYTFILYERDVSIWNPKSHQWEVPIGEYSFYIGSTSEIFYLSGTFKI